MTFIGKTLTAVMVAVYGMFVVTIPTAPKPSETVPSTVYTATTTLYSPVQATNPPNPTTTTTWPEAGNCDAYVAIAAHIGWPQTALETLRLAMRLESGCNPQAVGDAGDSIGLLQIHCPTWGTPNRNWPIGWIQHYGWGDCNDLFDPIVNLTVGLAIWQGWEGSTPGWQHWHALP
jgi:hypothetical protein